ncbi:MAG: hypothetical protein ACREJ3_11460 [Polyangiaceae bacterium]
MFPMGSDRRKLAKRAVLLSLAALPWMAISATVPALSACGSSTIHVVGVMQ